MTLTKKTFLLQLVLAIVVAFSFMWFLGARLALAEEAFINSNEVGGTGGTFINDPSIDTSNFAPTQGLSEVGADNYTNSNATGLQVTGTQVIENSCPTGEYCLLAPLPGIQDNIGQGQGFADYAQVMINLIIGLSALLAVLMFMIGGFTYMTGESIGGKAEGRKMMTNAIFGFVLLLGSYIILKTINPNLLNLDLNIEPTGTSVSERESPYTKEAPVTTPRGDRGANDIKAKQIFGSMFSVNKADCINPAQTNCSSIDGVDKNTVDAVKSLQEDCDSKFGGRCAVMLTAGDGIGIHKKNGAHPIGKAVDTSKFGVWNEYLEGFTKNLTPTKIDEGLLYSTKDPNGQDIRIIKEPNTWHIDTLTTSN